MRALSGLGIGTLVRWIVLTDSHEFETQASPMHEEGTMLQYGDRYLVVDVRLCWS